MINLSGYSTQEIIAELAKRRAETFGRLHGLIAKVNSPASVSEIEAEVRSNIEILQTPSVDFLLHEIYLVDRTMPQEAYMAAIEDEFGRLDFGIPATDVMRQWCVNDQRVEAYKSDAAHQFDRCGLNYWQVRKFYCWLKSRR